MCLYSGLSGRNFLACLHEETNSFRLFSVANSSLHMIKYFSQRQWLHLLIAQLYDLVRFKFFHIILNSIIHRLAKLTLDKHSYLLTSNILLIIVYVNTVKISYSRMPNVKKAADGHNKSKLSQTSTSDANTCNCRNNTPWIDKVCSNP